MKARILLLVLVLSIILSACNKTSLIYEDNIDQNMTNTNIDEYNNYNVIYTVGQSLFFGKYEQDGILENGKEDIEWFVIDKQGNDYLLISKYVLDCLQFDANKDDTLLWRNSSLRSWLNNEFYNNAFDNSEKSKIILSNVLDFDSKVFKDRIYILNYNDVNKYLVNQKIAEGTIRAFDACNEVKTEDKNKLCYWTRDLANDSKIPDVDIYGEYYKNGYPSNYIDGVRPAMWISLDSTTEYGDTLCSIKLNYNMRLRSDHVQNNRTIIRVVNSGSIFNAYEIIDDAFFTWYRVGLNEWLGDDCQCIEILDSNNNSTYINKVTIDRSKELFINGPNGEYVRTLEAKSELYAYETINVNNVIWTRIGCDAWIKD